MARRPATSRLAFDDQVLMTLRGLGTAYVNQVAAYMAEPDKIHGYPFVAGYRLYPKVYASLGRLMGVGLVQRKRSASLSPAHEYFCSSPPDDLSAFEWANA